MALFSCVCYWFVYYTCCSLCGLHELFELLFLYFIMHKCVCRVYLPDYLLLWGLVANCCLQLLVLFGCFIVICLLLICLLVLGLRVICVCWLFKIVVDLICGL